MTGGRVEKIYQPEVDEITLSVKNNGKMHTLVISASPSSPRAHLTAQKKENALNAPAFCMLLRKYLSGGNISSVSIFNFDRIIKFTFEARNELKDRTQYFLIAELMGRYSNIILTDADYKIIDAIRRIHFDQSTTRYILPNLPYVLQPKNKVSLDDNDGLDKIFSSEISDYNELPKLISGIGKESAKEIFYSDNPRDKIASLVSIFGSDGYAPVLKTENGRPKDFYVCRYATAEGEFIQSETLNQCLDTYYTLYDGDERKKADSKTAATVLKRLQAKNERRIKDNLDKIKDKPNLEKTRNLGELILNNLWQIKSGDSCKVIDYSTGEEVVIKLDPTLTPARNAQAYFKKYNKLKRGVEIAENQLDELYMQKEYLKSIEASIVSCATKQEFSEILQELNTLNGFKRKSKDKKKEKTSKPASIKYGECEIIFGKNNIQNNEVTFKIAARNDLWLHVKARHGSHVIIKGDYDESTLIRAAQIAAYYSDARNDDKVEIDFTEVKYVKKIPSSLPGQVTYTHYKTVAVSPLKEH